jgi:hypothetical protein
MLYYKYRQLGTQCYTDNSKMVICAVNSKKNLQLK